MQIYEMFPLNLPLYPIKIVERDGKRSVLDEMRRKYVALTPEEWVRQQFIHYLINEKKYPKTLLANEVSIVLNGMKRRCDTILYTNQLKPRMIIEYKSPTVDITQKVFSQICNYNWVLKADYLIVSNGLKHFCCSIDYANKKYNFLPSIPDYLDLGVKL